MTDDDMKREIDGMSYEDLLRRWRFAAAGDSYFQGEVGKYYAAVMRSKRAEVGGAEAVRASKAIGWEK